MKRICTHDGRFHCDEVLACTLLRNFTTEFRNAQVIRSRDPKVWETADILVDVGGKYEPPRLLDHHQIEFQETFPSHNIRMSSAGLVYLHFPEIIRNAIEQILAKEREKINFEPIWNEKICAQIRQKLYRNFVIFVDANDNGVDRVYEKQVSAVPTTLWSRVAKLNPMWWEEGADEQMQFQRAMNVVQEQFISEVRQSFLGSIQTTGIVRTAFENRKNTHSSGKILLLNSYVPWQKGLYSLEEELNCFGEILFVVFPQKSRQKWRIQAVAKKEGSFELRIPLREEWRGIKDMEKLRNLSGIDDIDFVHASGFIGGAISLESVISMGVRSLEHLI